MPSGESDSLDERDDGSVDVSAVQPAASVSDRPTRTATDRSPATVCDLLKDIPTLLLA
jgi:hypothetical protein